MCQCANAHLISQVGVLIPSAGASGTESLIPLTMPLLLECKCRAWRGACRGRGAGHLWLHMYLEGQGYKLWGALLMHNNSLWRRNLTFVEKTCVEKKTRHPQVYGLWKFTGFRQLGPFHSLNRVSYFFSWKYIKRQTKKRKPDAAPLFWGPLRGISWALACVWNSAHCRGEGRHSGGGHRILDG